jgi:hypothetical protein
MASNIDDERRRKWEEGADEEHIALRRHTEFRAMLAAHGRGCEAQWRAAAG